MSMTVLGALRRLDESRYRAELYRGWGTALGAGLTHGVALEQIGRLHSGRTEEARRYLVVGAQQGRPVAALVKARPGLFEPFEAAILAAGEESGTLLTSLRLLAEHYARDFRRMLRVRLLMGYPVYAGVLASFVITQPFLSRGGWKAYVIAIAGALAAFLLLGGVVLTLFANFIGAGASYTLPRFARTLATGLHAGLPLGRAVRFAVDVSGSPVLRAHLAKRSEREIATMPLAALFEGCRAVPAACLTQMRVADATGDYLHTLGRYADSLEEDRR